jgi:hypothetical protein
MAGHKRFTLATDSQLYLSSESLAARNQRKHERPLEAVPASLVGRIPACRFAFTHRTFAAACARATFPAATGIYLAPLPHVRDGRQPGR